MTTITLQIKDESKTNDVLRFLRKIDFVEVSEPVLTSKPRGLEGFGGFDLGWSKGMMNRDEMNAR